MPANKLNFVVLYDNECQVYGAGTKEIALATPPPKGATLEEKKVFYITYNFEDGQLVVHPVPQEEVEAAEIVERKKKSDD